MTLTHPTKIYNSDALKNIPLNSLAEDLGIQRKSNDTNFECFSPEHKNQEQRPSLSIKDEEGFYCHKNCGVKGTDAIAFYQQYSNCNFQEACEWLSKKYSISILEGDINTQGLQKPSPKYSDLLTYEKYLEYAKEFKNQTSPVSRQAKKELEGRNISLETAIQYQVAVIENLFIPKIQAYNDSNNAKLETNYDVLAFPMFNTKGIYIGMKYRLFHDDFQKTPKEAGLQKSMTLTGSKSGLLFITEGIQNTSEILLCEGEIDGLSLASLGFKNVLINLGGVGNCIPLIKKICLDKKVISLYDQDEAGKKANTSLCKKLSRPLHIVDLPCSEGKETTDVNDKILEGWETDEFEAAIEDAKVLGEIKGETIKTHEGFLSYLRSSSNIQPVYSSGIIDNKFYHLIYCPKPFVIFSDKSFVEIEDNGRFIYQDQEYRLRQSPIPESISDSIHTVNKEAIAQFIEKKCAIEKTQLFSMLITILKKYYEFYEEKEVEIIVCHIIHSYILGLLGRTVYLLLVGEKGTGKSSLQTLMSKLQFNGCFSGKSSVPVTVRKVHCFQAALNLDEFEKMPKEEKQIVTGVFNTGYLQGGTYEITDMQQTKASDQIKSFYTFSTKTFSANSSKGFDDSLISRCFSINTIKNTQKISDIHCLSQKEEQVFQNIRNELFRYCMEHWEELKASYLQAKEFFESKGIMGRVSDTLGILGGVHYHFNNNIAFYSYLMKREQFCEDEKKNPRVEIIFDYLENKLSTYICNEDSEIEVVFTNQELVDEINDKLEPGEEFMATAKSISVLLKSYRILDSVHSRSERMTQGVNKGKTKYLVQYHHLCSILGRQGRFMSEDENKSEESQKQPSPREPPL